MMTIIIVTVLAFGLSFVFALGGVGAAVALVPVLHWYGLPLSVAKTTGLLTNTLSMTGASVDNIRKKRLDFRLGLPIIISSFIFAPVGAWSSHYIPKSVILGVFTLFLLFSGVMLIFFRANKFEDQFRDDCPVVAPAIIGVIAGVLDIIPSLGPTLAAIIAVTIALFEGSMFLPVENWLFAVIILAIFLVIQQIENIWIRPALMGRRLRLHPAIVFISVLTSLALFGILVTLIIIPLLSSLAMITRYLRDREWENDL